MSQEKARQIIKDEHDPRLVHVEVLPTNARWKEHRFGEYNRIEL